MSGQKGRRKNSVMDHLSGYRGTDLKIMGGDGRNFVVRRGGTLKGKRKMKGDHHHMFIVGGEKKSSWNVPAKKDP